MTLAYQRGGVQYVIETKAAKWRPEDHPRDSKGRFIETGAEVRVMGVGLGKVTDILTHDRIEVQMHADGSLRRVDKDALTVIARKDGTAPTSDPKLVQAAEQGKTPEAPGAHADVEWESAGKGPHGGENLKAQGPDWKATVTQTAAGYRWSVYAGGSMHGDAKTSDEAIEAARREVERQRKGRGGIAEDGPLPAGPKAPEAPAGPKDLGEAPDWRGAFTVERDEDGDWNVTHTASGKLITAGVLVPKTRGAAEEIAARLMDIRDKNTGDRVDWAEADPKKVAHAALDAGYVDVLKDVVNNHTGTGPIPDVPELRDHLNALAHAADLGGRREHAEKLRDAAGQPKLMLSPGGHLALSHNKKKGGKNPQPESWNVFDARSGLRLGTLGDAIPGGKDGALAFAYRLETELIGADGKPFDWSAPDVQDRIKAWRTEDGRTLGKLLQETREDHNTNPEKWKPPTVKAPDQEVPDDAAAPDGSGGDADGLRPDGAGPLEEPPADQVPGDVPAGEGAVLRGARGGDRPGGDDSGGRDRGDGAEGRAVPGDGEAPGNGPAGRRGRRPAADAPDGGRAARRRGGRSGGDDAGGQPDPLAQPRPGRRVGRGVSPDSPRFQPGGMGDLAPSGEKARVAANMAALRTLRTLQAENRPATAEEQSVLARWGGWGAIPDVFDEAPSKAAKFADERAELKRILTPKEYNAARRNTINAHYTDPAIAQAMWDGMGKLGFTGGRVLEPGSGAGTFVGLRPESVDMVGVELDPITAGISRYLYPDANILNESFAKTRMPEGAFDGVIGNVPFGKIALVDPKYNKNKHTIHNHFIVKSLRMTRPGGVVAVLTSRHTLDAEGEAGQAARAEMAKYGELIGAVRLPTGSHRRASGTDVVIDMLVFRRREDPEPPPLAPKKPGKKATADAKAQYETDVQAHEVLLARYQREQEARAAAQDKSWTQTVEIEVPSDTEEGGTAKVAISRYFADNPDMVLGEVRATRGQHSANELGVVSATRGEDLGAEVAAAMDRLAASATERGLLATERDTTETPLPEIMDAGAADQEGHLEEGTEVYTRTITHSAKGELLKDKAGNPKPRVETTTFTVVRNGAVVPHFISKTDAAELRDLMGLRDVASALLAAEAASSEDTPEIDQLRAELNRLYDAYVAAPGADKKPRGAINRQSVSYGSKVTDKDTVDPETGETIPAGTEIETTTVRTPPQGKFRRTRKSALVYALEKYNPTTGEATKASIFTQRTVAPREPRQDADNPVDALSITMDTHGEVKLRTVADLLGVDESEARMQLGTLVFDDPTDEAPDHLTVAAEYLSGDVRAKLAAARELAEADPERFAANVAALETVVPKDLTPEDIKAKLGVPWVGAKDVQLFLRETLGVRDIKVKKLGSEWEIEGSPGELGKTVWGTERMDALKIAKAALESRRPKITKKVTNPDGSERDVPDPVASAAAQDKIDDLNDRFQAWLWEDPTRSERIVKLYNDRYNALVLRQYDTEGERDMPGLAEKFTLRGHQHAAINRVVAEQSVLLAHEVGAGKTLEMIGGAMELRRLGLARKPAIAVPNHMLEQFSREFLDAYPDANILVATEDQMQGDNRREFVARCATGDWDAIIITHSAFGRIPMSPEAQEAYIDREMQIHREEADAKREAVESSGKSEKQKDASLKKIEGQLIAMEERLKARLESARDDGVTFEETGIDYVMVDEAHLFKNLMTPSNVESVSVAGSMRSADLHMKLDYLRQRNESGRVATFATATPVSNSMSEMYTMMRYLRPDLLEAQGVRTFDDWAAMHGRMVSDVEITAGGSFKMKSRFAEFVNVPELLRVFHTFADVKTAADLGLPTPKVRGGKPTTIAVDRNDAQGDYIASLAARAEALQGKRRPGKGEDNHLQINTDGRKAALDLRLVGQDMPGGNPKLEAAADNIAKIYEANKDRVYSVEGTMDKDPDTKHLVPGTGTPHGTTGALQIVFCDLGTPGGKRKEYIRDVNGEIVTDDDGEATFRMVDSTWNAYDEMRDLMVARGIPRNKIAFVHDAKNDAEKAKLFERARTGEIAVLIGSTAKMGVGTNVQNRAIALHHLDCPWRPTDLVQRNGRIERQGNQHEEVDIFQYVVKDTFDAKSWGTVTQKARYIGQVMTGTLDQRDVEDVGTSAQTLAEVMAIAADNPHLSEQIRNNARVSQLQRQDKQHTYAQQSLRSNKEKYERQIVQGGKLIEQLDLALAQRQDVSGDKFKLAVMPYSAWGAPDTLRHYDKRKEANEALSERITGILDSYSQSYYGQDIAEIGGFTVRYEPRTNPKTGAREAVLTLKGVPGSATVVDRAVLETTNGVTSRLENRLAEMEGTRARTVEAIADAERKIPIVERNIGQVFARADELRYVERRQEILAEIMALYGRESRQPDGNDEPSGPTLRETVGDEIAGDLAAITGMSPDTRSTTREEGFGQKLAHLDAELDALDAEWRERTGGKVPEPGPAPEPIVDTPDVTLPDADVPGRIVAPRQPRDGDVTLPSTPGPATLPEREKPEPGPAPERPDSMPESRPGGGGTVTRPRPEATTPPPEDEPSPIVPGPSRPPGEPGLNPLAGFDRATQADIRNLIEERGYQYAGEHFGGTSGVARYLAEGPLSKYTDKHGLNAVWTAASRYLEQHPEARTRSREEAQAIGEARRARGKELDEQATAAFLAKDYDRALAIVDELEDHDAAHYNGTGMTFAEARKLIRERQRQEQPPEPDVTPDEAPPEPDQPPWSNLAEFRQYLGAVPDSALTDLQGDALERHRGFLGDLANSSLLYLAPEGNVFASSTGGRWSIGVPASGAALPGMGRFARNKAEATALARAVARDLRDADGRPLPWNLTRDAALAWRSDRGERLGDAIVRLRAETPGLDPEGAFAREVDRLGQREVVTPPPAPEPGPVTPPAPRPIPTRGGPGGVSEQEFQRLLRTRNREEMGLDDRWGVGGAGLSLGTITTGKARRGDVVYTGRANPTTQEVELPTARGANNMLPNSQRNLRVIDRIEKRGDGQHVLHFTDGTFTSSTRSARELLFTTPNAKDRQAAYDAHPPAEVSPTPPAPERGPEPAPEREIPEPEPVPDMEVPPAPDVTPEPEPPAPVTTPPQRVPELASVRALATWAAGWANDQSAEADLRAALSPMHSAARFAARRRIVDGTNERAKQALLTLEPSSAHKVNGRRGFDPDRARAAAQRLADGDVTLPALSVGQRVLLSVVDPTDDEIRIRNGRAESPRHIDVEVTVTAAKDAYVGQLHVIGTDANGEVHVVGLAGDGVVRPAGVTAPPVPEVTPEPPAAPGELNRPDDAAIETFNAATGGAADALTRAGDETTANSVRWAADRLLDAWRYETGAELRPAAEALSALLAEAKVKHKDNPDVVAWLSVAQLAWSGDVPELPEGPPERPPTGPERPGAVFDPDAPDEAIYGVRGRKGRPRVPAYQGKPKGKPPLYTYQRRNILAYRFDTEHPNEDVRLAARALRYYEPITSEQATALAKALRQRAEDDGDKRKARSARTAAARLDIVGQSLGAGYGRPTSGIDAEDHYAFEVQAGTRITLPEQGRHGAITGTVESKRIRYAGRVVELSIRDDATGELTTRQVLKGTPMREVDGPAPVRLPTDPDPEPLAVTGPVPGTIVEVGTGDTVAIPDGDRVVQGVVTDATALPDGQMLVTVTGGDGASTPVVAPDQHPAWQLPPTINEPAPVPGGDEQFVPARTIKEGDVIWPAGDESRAFAVEEIREEGGLLVFAGHDDDGEEVETPAPVGGQVFLGERARDAAESFTPPPSPVTDGRPETVTRQTIRPGDTIRLRSHLGQDVTGLVTETWPENGEEDDGTPVEGVGVLLLMPGNDVAVTINLFGNDTADLLDRREDSGPVIERTEHEQKVDNVAKWMRQVHGEAQYAIANLIQGAVKSEDGLAATREQGYVTRAPLSPEQVVQKILADLDDPHSDVSRRLNNLRAGIATKAVERYGNGYPDIPTASRATLTVDGLLRDIQIREVTALVKSLREAPDQGSMRRMLDAIAAHPEPRPTPLYRVEAETLVRAVRSWQTDGFDWADPQLVDPGEVPETSPGEDIATRIARYRRALPENMADFGKVAMRQTRVPKLTVEDLAAGRIPPPTTEDVFGDDKAADGGPGRVTLRNLEVVTAAGRALAEEIDRRVEELLPEGHSAEAIAALDSKVEAAREAAAEARRAARLIGDAANQAAAESLGFASKAEWTSAFLRKYRATAAEVPGEREARDAWDKAVEKARADRGADVAGTMALHKALLAERAVLTKARKDAHRQATLELLAKVRAMGPGDGAGIQWVNKDRKPIKRGKLLDAMRWAEQHYPSDWLIRAGKGRPIFLGSSTRGNHRSRGKSGLPEIRLSSDVGGEHVTGAGEYGRVAVHELGHDMEDVIPGLKALEAAFLFRRTTDEGTQVGSRTRTGKNARRSMEGYSRSEQARGNDFAKAYSGKEYIGGSHELITTASESLFAGSEYLDDDFRSWALGVLAVL